MAKQAQGCSRAPEVLLNFWPQEQITHLPEAPPCEGTIILASGPTTNARVANELRRNYRIHDGIFVRQVTPSVLRVA